MSDECEHFSQRVDGVTPKTKGCEECEKTKTPWVAIRQCLTCGHVGCCDSSTGRHILMATHGKCSFSHSSHPFVFGCTSFSFSKCSQNSVMIYNYFLQN